MTTAAQILDDLRAEGDELAGLLVPLSPVEWGLPTPAEGWTVAHQISHLAWTDRIALRAANEPDAFAAELSSAAANPLGFVESGATEGVGENPAALLDRWQRGRAQLADVLTALPRGARLPWFGPPMSAASMATARLMETWAHGLDVADALGAERKPTSRLRHVAHLGVRTRDFAFRMRDLEPPAEEFRVELTGPDGDTWTWGSEDAAQHVTGPALDFCLLVTRRAHRADLALDARGGHADRWLDIAQAFAGPPGAGRQPEGHG